MSYITNDTIIPKVKTTNRLVSVELHVEHPVRDMGYGNDNVCSRKLLNYQSHIYLVPASWICISFNFYLFFFSFAIKTIQLL